MHESDLFNEESDIRVKCVFNFEKIKQILSASAFPPFLTGSYYWGYKNPSDIDICIPMIDMELITHYLEEKNIKWIDGAYYRCIYIPGDSAETRLNLIFLSVEDMEIWKIATQIMLAYPRIKNKNVRHAMFEQIRSQIKIILSL